MGNIYKDKKRCCAGCKPHKRRWAHRNKPQYIEPKDDIQERLTEIYWVDGEENIAPKPKLWYDPSKVRPRRRRRGPLSKKEQEAQQREINEWHERCIREAEEEASLSNKSEAWHKQQLKYIEDELKDIPLVGEAA